MNKKKGNATIIIISIISIIFLTLNVKNITNANKIKTLELKKGKYDSNKNKDIFSNISYKTSIFYDINYKEYHSTEMPAFRDKFFFISYDFQRDMYLYTMTDSDTIPDISTFSDLTLGINNRLDLLIELLKKINIKSSFVEIKENLKRVKSFPIIKISPVSGFKLINNTYVPISYFAILYLKETIPDRVYEEININTLNVVREKEKKIIKILDNFSLVLEGIQVGKDKKNALPINYLSGYGSSNIYKTGTNSFAIGNIVNNIKKEEMLSGAGTDSDKFFLNTNGFLAISVDRLDIGNLDLTNSSIMTGITGKRASYKFDFYTDPNDSNLNYNDDYMIFDFRNDLADVTSTNSSEFSIDSINNNTVYNNYLDGSLTNFLSDYNQEDIENSRVLCSLNDNCALQYQFNDGKIQKILPIETYNYFLNETQFITANSSFVDQGVNKYLNENNPFFIQGGSINNKYMDIFIDISSGMSYQKYTFSNPNNNIIFTVAAQKGFTLNCDSCNQGDLSNFIYKRYFIIKG